VLEHDQGGIEQLVVGQVVGREGPGADLVFDGGSSIGFIMRSVETLLDKGFKRHILGFTLRYLLKSMTEGKKKNEKLEEEENDEQPKKKKRRHPKKWTFPRKSCSKLENWTVTPT